MTYNYSNSMSASKFFIACYCFVLLTGHYLVAQSSSQDVQGIKSTNFSSKATEEVASNKSNEIKASENLNVFTPNLGDNKSNESANDYLFLWFKMFLFLAIFIIGSMIFIKYLKSKNKFKSSKSDYFQIYAELPLEINKKLQIVKIINEFYVLAVGVENVNLIAKIEDKEGIDLLELKGSVDSRLKSSFFQDVASNYFHQENNLKRKFNALNITKNLKKRMQKLKN